MVRFGLTKEAAARRLCVIAILNGRMAVISDWHEARTLIGRDLIGALRSGATQMA
jgi:hypothetical protein